MSGKVLAQIFGLALLFVGSLSLTAGTDSTEGAKDNRWPGPEKSLATKLDKLFAKTIGIWDHIAEYAYYYLENNEGVSSARKNYFEKVGEISKARSKFVKLRKESSMMAGFSFECAQDAISLSNECASLVNRVRKFNMLLTQYEETDLQRLVTSQIAQKELSKSDSIDYPIFLRWLDGKFVDSDFLVHKDR